MSCSSVVSKDLQTLELEYQLLLEKNVCLSGPNLYMYGLLLKQKNKQTEAKHILIQSLQKTPLLWSAWLEL